MNTHYTPPTRSSSQHAASHFISYRVTSRAWFLLWLLSIACLSACSSLDNGGSTPISDHADSEERDSSQVSTNLSSSPSHDNTPAQGIRGCAEDFYQRLAKLKATRLPLARFGAITHVVPTCDLKSGTAAVLVSAKGVMVALDSTLKSGSEIGSFPFSPKIVDVDPYYGIATGWDGRVIELLDLAEGQSVARLTKLVTRITALRTLASQEAVLIGGADGRIYRWKYNEPDLKKALERYFGPSTIISALVPHPGGRVFFSGDWNGGLNAWLPYDQDAFKGKYDQNIFRGVFAETAVRQNAARVDAVSITDLLISPSGEALYTVLQDGRIEWWMVRGLKKLGEVQAHKGVIYSAALNADGSRLATVGRDGSINVFSLEFTDGSPPTVAFTPLWKKLLREARAAEFIDSAHVLVIPESSASANNASLLSFDLHSGSVPEVSAPDAAAVPHA